MNRDDKVIMNMLKEKIYIFKRKLQALGSGICFYMCRLFPIDKKLISVCTFEGRGGFGCNPKYIVEALHKLDSTYSYVWFVNDINKELPEYIKKVPNTVLSRAYWLTRSMVWIDNYRKPYGTKKRKGQLYINTWHATQGFKSIGLWRGKAFSTMAYLVSKNDSDMVDFFVTDSKWCDEVNPKGMVYDGNFLKVGAPRCDVLYGDRSKYKKTFRLKHKISEDAKVVMYAPTFREGSKNGKRLVFSEIWSIDFNRLIENLKKRFGGEWYVCIRVHPQRAEACKEYKNTDIQKYILDESKADDMYEILAAMDAYITDYSSAAMDASLTHMPVFMYADDIVQYTKDRGSLLWNLSDDTSKPVTNNKKMTPNLDLILPFSVSKDNDELERNILNFNKKEYLDKIKKYEDGVELVFNGDASEKVAREIVKFR